MIALGKRCLIYFTFVLAWMLMILPIPYGWQWLRPEWASLVLIYWVFKEPLLVGVFTAWCVGFVMDVLAGGLLGQHALALAIVAYLAHLLRNRLGLFPFWQQSFVVLVLVGFGQLVLLLVQWLIGEPPRSLAYWASVLTSVAVWPLVYQFLNSLVKEPVIRH